MRLEHVLAGIVLVSFLDPTHSQSNSSDFCVPTTTIIHSSSSPDESMIIEWPETEIGMEAIVPCPCGHLTKSGLAEINRFARRLCEGSSVSGATWSEMKDLAECNYTEVSRMLCQSSTLPTPDMLKSLEQLTEQADLLDPVAVSVTVAILEEAVSEIQGDRELSEGFLSVLDRITTVSSETLEHSNLQSNSTQRLLQLLDTVSKVYPLPLNQTSVIIPRHNFAIAIQKVVNSTSISNGQAFIEELNNHSTAYISSDALELSFSSKPNSTALASVSISAETIERVLETQDSELRLIYTVFISDALFKGNGGESTSISSGAPQTTGLVVGATWCDSTGDIGSPLLFTFQKTLDPGGVGEISACPSWNVSAEDGYGGWSMDGCQLTLETSSAVVCHCNRSGYFTYWSDLEFETQVPVNPQEIHLIKLISLGCIISSVCLIITITTYLASRKLRSSTHGKLLLNLSFALLAVYFCFIAQQELTGGTVPCAVISVLCQYFLLVMGLAMAAEAVMLYIKLVKVISQVPPHFPLKAAIVSWVTPLFVVGISLVAGYNLEVYERFGNCGTSGYAYYFGLLLPLGLTFLFNWTVFATITLSIFRRQWKMNAFKKGQSSQGIGLKRQIGIAFILSVILGLGWGFGFFLTLEEIPEALYDIFLVMFIIFAALQGLLIFILQCVRVPEARDEWKKVLLFCWSPVHRATLKRKQTIVITV